MVAHVVETLVCKIERAIIQMGVPCLIHMFQNYVILLLFLKIVRLINFLSNPHAFIFFFGIIPFSTNYYGEAGARDLKCTVLHESYLCFKQDRT